MWVTERRRCGNLSCNDERCTVALSYLDTLHGVVTTAVVGVQTDGQILDETAIRPQVNTAEGISTYRCGQSAGQMKLSAGKDIVFTTTGSKSSGPD